MENYEFCIIDNEKDIIEYEKTMYETFMKKSPGSWTLKNGEIIDDCRLKPKLSYDNLIIYGAKYNNQLIAGVKANIDKNNFQFEKMGFTISNEEKSKNICEGINYFITDYQFDDPMKMFNIAEQFSIDFLNDVKNRGYIAKYGTSSRKLKIMYLRMGYEVYNNSIKIDDENLFLIKIDLLKYNKK